QSRQREGTAADDGHRRAARRLRPPPGRLVRAGSRGLVAAAARPPPPQRDAQLHRQRELRLGGGARGAGLAPERQVRRRLPAGALLADIAHSAGLVAGGAHPSPVPYAEVVTTTTHKTLRGPRGALILCSQEHAKAVDRAVFPGLQGGPHLSAIAAKAVCFQEALRPEFRQYGAQVVDNGAALADELLGPGFSLWSGGTDNHLLGIKLLARPLPGA